MEKQELVKLKQRKTEKTEERENKKHKNKTVKEHKTVVNGKEHIEGSGTMTFSYKKLQVPKELIKKAKKLVETTTGLNSTFIQFIQQAADEQGEKSIRYRHLKAFKAVLADLKKAHSALEEALEPEFRGMEMQNGNEGQHNIRKNTDVAPVENDHMDIATDAVDAADAVDGADVAEELDEEQHKQLDKEQHNEHDVDHDQVSHDAEMKENQTETNATKKTIKTDVCDDRLMPTGEMSLDQDIMSVPPSVPEELFQLVESLADSTMLSQTDSDLVTDTEKDGEKAKSNGRSTDAQRPQPKVKNLIVKLTPVPVVTTCGSRSSRSKNRENDEDKQKRCSDEEECEEKKDNADDATDGANSPLPGRRSSRVKTTPLRKQTENKDKEESSESESEEDSKSKAKFSKSSSNTKKDDSRQTKASDKKTVDSDSDEVPDILLERGAAGHSTDEEQGNTSAKKRLFKLNNTSVQDTDKVSKRKRKFESSDSDLEKKSKKISKNKKQNGSDSSNSDSDQEKGTKNKVGTAKRRSSRVKKQDGTKEDDKNSTERKAAERKRSYENKRKGRSSKSASKLQSSSSEDEEEQQAEGDSGEDSDEQKIKVLVEDNLVEGGGPFHQSSGNFS